MIEGRPAVGATPAAGVSRPARVFGGVGVEFDGKRVKLVDGTGPPWLRHVRDLFLEYRVSLSVDLSFQGFEEELASLPGLYGHARGRLLVAAGGSDALGCVGLREIDERTAELKRLYVRPRARGLGVGRRLSQAMISAASELRYNRIVLDTLPNMAGAQRLYRELGFREIDAYTDNPVPGVRFMELDLDRR